MVFAVGDLVECVTESVGVTVGRQYLVVGVLCWAIDGKGEQALELAGVNGAVLASRFKAVDDGQSVSLDGETDEPDEPTVLSIGDTVSALGLDVGPQVIEALTRGADDEFWLSLAEGRAPHILSLGAMSLIAVDSRHDVAVLEQLVELLNLGMDIRRHHERQKRQQSA